PSEVGITCYGTEECNLGYVYRQDSSVLNGTIGEMHARKITGLYRLAMKTGAPVIGLIDCGGVRLEESTDALNAMGAVMKCEALASGVIPQITAVFGTCGGGMSIVTALSDFTYVETSKGRLFLNAPDAVCCENKTDKCDTASADFRFGTGEADFIGTEAEIFANMRALIAMLPGNNEVNGEIVPTNDDPNRAVTNIENLKDMSLALAMIADNGIFTEVKKGYAKGTVTGFMRLNGETVGAIANNSKEMKSSDAKKIASMIRFCDAYSIPVVTLVNTEKFGQCPCTEKTMADNSAALVNAYAMATVPKVTLIAGKAYGTPYILMGSKAIGADMVYAWSKAEIGMMDANAAAKIMYADSDAETIKKGAEEFKALQQNVNSAAARGYVDTIIEPADTRKYLIGALDMLYTKREMRPDKKHASI
ncbi:MAG: carboxyl transferase, partial [Lachnospiraceae bacterium]|nr:carboxyl transferase [Candidatus Equihabitans merdae]